MARQPRRLSGLNQAGAGPEDIPDQAAFDAYVGPARELTVDAQRGIVALQDGNTPGGVRLARNDQRNIGALGYVEVVKADDYTITAVDSGKCLVADKATAIAFSFDPADDLGADFICLIKNVGAGALTLDPDGAETVDGEATYVLATGTSLIVKGDGSALRTYLENSTGAAINEALAKTALVDDDKIGIIDSEASNFLKKITFANFISSLFTTARKIANGYFLSSFRLWDTSDPTKGLAFSLANIANATIRTITMPDADVDLTKVGIKNGGTIALSGTSIELPDIPSGAQRVILSYKMAVSSGGVVLLELGSSGGFPGSGYSGTASNLNASTVASAALATTSIGLSASTTPYPGRFVFEKQSGNVWTYTGDSQIASNGNRKTNGEVAGLSGELTRFRLSTGGAPTLSGEAKVWWEL